MSLPKLQESTICGVIVSYHPDNGFPQRLSLILPQVNEIVIVDNSASDEMKKRLLKLKDNNKINIISNDRNRGIATALNQGIHWAQKHGYTWVLTLDQDTIPEEFMVTTLISVYETVIDKDKTAVIGSNYVDMNSHKIMIRSKARTNRLWTMRKAVITSGSLISLNVFADIGPFRDEFFIDEVDHEYCLRASARGYHIILALKPLMKHSLGETKSYTLLGIPGLIMNATNHPPFRWYYITRNRLILTGEYLFKDMNVAVVYFFLLLRSITTMCCFEKCRLEKTKYILLGVLDALISNTKRKITIPDP